MLMSYTGSPLHPLYSLAKELEARGLGATVDTSISVVDGFLLNPQASTPIRLRACSVTYQRAILRPDPNTAHPWWWLLWPGDRFEEAVVEPSICRLLPVEDTEDVARRIRNVLILDSTE